MQHICVLWLIDYPALHHQWLILIFNSNKREKVSNQAVRVAFDQILTQLRKDVR